MFTLIPFVTDRFLEDNISKRSRAILNILYKNKIPKLHVMENEIINTNSIDKISIDKETKFTRIKFTDGTERLSPENPENIVVINNIQKG